jgi:hypothetical protein
MTQDVKRCSRCGGNHTALVFKKFDRPVAPADLTSTSWSHWAPCPATGEPILLSVSPFERHDAPVRQNFED